jgi:phosphatidate cytidylyltransferase
LLKWRLISAAIIISGLTLLLYLDFHYPLRAPGIWLIPLAVAASLMISYELLDLWSERADRPAGWTVYSGSLLVLLATCGPLLWPITNHSYPEPCPLGRLGWPLLAMAASVALAFLGEMARYVQPGKSLTAVALSVFAVAYGGLLLSFLVQLRLFHNHAWGMVALISTVVIVKMSDTGAYFTGRLAGRHKMAPVLSPGKTIEGGVGGLVFAVLGGWFSYAVLVPWLVGPTADRGPWYGWLAYGVIVAVAGVLGDLAESLLKRDAGRKDSSSWLPGLGGVLDILDSLLFAAPPAFVCWAVGLVGP